jgi:uncharacterized membrane protein
MEDVRMLEDRVERGRRDVRRRRIAGLLIALTLGLAAVLALTARPATATAAQRQPVARAVFFYSPGCPHCHELINGQLPGIVDQFGRQLRLLSVDASAPVGRRLFRNTVQKYSVPAYLRGVPAIVIGDHFLAGVTDISEQLPQLAAQYLAEGGVAWPKILGLPAALVASRDAVVTSPGQLLATTGESKGLLDRLAADRWGNTLALIVLAGMLGSVGLVVAGLVSAFRRRVAADRASEPSSMPTDRRLIVAVAALLVLGVGITAYLSYAHATASATLCGPVGNCDAVQQSSYSRLFGALPVAYLGLAGYIGMAVAFAVSRLASGALAVKAAWTFLGLALAGALFTIYLTALEPFVIGASCMWCLGSAVTVTLLLLLAAQGLGLLGRVSSADKTRAAAGGSRA